MTTVMQLEAFQQRTLAAGAHPDRRADFWTVMAEMREQGFDPCTEQVACVWGPLMITCFTGYDGDLMRCLFRILGSHPWIEFEVDLLPALLSSEDWRSPHSPTQRLALPAGWAFGYRPEWHTG